MRVLALLFVAAITACAASDPHGCRPLTFEDQPFTVCTFNAAEHNIRLFHSGDDGRPHGHFDKLADAVRADRNELVFAMNAGMYHEDRAPVGYYVEDGVETAPLVMGPSAGNFGMQPNGVFYLIDDRAGVAETEQFSIAKTGVAYATQSGPMLVIEGALHPKFNVDGPSRKRRNGVGVMEDGQTIHFVISDIPVNFHTFARVFRDALAAPNALYFDGFVSRLYDPENDRHEEGLAMGPIVGVVKKARQGTPK